jgi:alanyl-tRNA synthetase
VLRRIIRRAIRHGYKLGQKGIFFHRLVADLARVMGEAYPELVKVQGQVESALLQEEMRFAETLENGMAVLESQLHNEDRMLSGEVVFKLYDTYGFPIDLTADIARERGVAVDLAGFEQAMEEQRERARSASRFSAQAQVDYAGENSEFLGYDSLTAQAQVVALYQNGEAVGELTHGQSGVVILDRTPFYAESGGQVGDRGELVASHGTFQVTDTQKVRANVPGHQGEVVTGRIALGDMVECAVDIQLRQHTAWNHSATHLLHAALRTVLGTHVAQKGSHVDEHRTRFDFSHDKPVTDAELRHIEALVNREIRHNHAVDTRIMKYDDAVKRGAMALFGEKYEDEVRVIAMGEFSTELCGGTHVRRSGDMGLFKIISESGVASGVRRIEAVTGDRALEVIHAEQDQLLEIASRLKTQPAEIASRLNQILDNVRSLEKEVDRLKSKMAASGSADLANQVVEVKGVRLLAAQIEGADGKLLREMMDSLKAQLGSAVIVLGSGAEGKVSLIAGVTPDLTNRIKAGELVNFVASQVGGKGGGRPDMAQAGGTLPEQLPAAMAAVAGWVEKAL